MDVRSGLIEYNNDVQELRCSGIIIENNWVIFPAAMFLAKLQEMPDYLKNLSSGQLIYKNFFQINETNTKIFLKPTQNYPLHFVACFSCKNIKNSEKFSLVCAGYDNSVNEILSMFIIAQINPGNWDILKGIIQLLRQCENNVRGSEIYIESAPFGSTDLMGTRSKGIVSNCFGENGCYFLTDASSAPGCEGGPVFMENNRNMGTQWKCDLLSGIVISPINVWRGEHTGLTLGVSIVPLLSQLIPDSNSMSRGISLNKSNFINLIDSSLAQIFCGADWGTAVLLDKKNSIFITAAHVIPQSTVRIKWQNVEFPGYVVFKATKNSAYDIAIIQGVPSNTKKMVALKLATNEAQQGEPVIAAGFPIFKSSNAIYPTVSRGNVSLSNEFVFHTTCNILSGASGGAILRPNCELLGIIICHTVLPDNNSNIVYPKINMAVPISAIRGPVLEYLQNGDVSVLQKLNCKDLDVINKWRLFRSKL